MSSQGGSTAVASTLPPALPDAITTPTEVPAEDGVMIVALVAAILLAVVCARLALLALWIRRHDHRQTTSLWEYYLIAGTIGAVYGGLTAVGIVAGHQLLVLDGLLLGVVVATAFTMRAAYDVTTGADGGGEGLLSLQRTVELLFIGFVLVAAFGPLVDVAVAAQSTAVAAVAAVGYGLTYQRRRIVGSATRGTPVDSLLRFTAPMLVFAGGALVVGAVEFVGVAIDTSVTAALQSVFLLLTASTALSVTTKLATYRQGL